MFHNTSVFYIGFIDVIISLKTTLADRHMSKYWHNVLKKYNFNINTEMLIIPKPDQEGKSYSDQTLSFARHSKKKKTEICPSNQVYAAAMTSGSDEKWRTFNLFFQSGRAKDLSASLYNEELCAVLAVWRTYCFIDGIGMEEMDGTRSMRGNDELWCSYVSDSVFEEEGRRWY